MHQQEGAIVAGVAQLGPMARQPVEPSRPIELHDSPRTLGVERHAVATGPLPRAASDLDARRRPEGLDEAVDQLRLVRRLALGRVAGGVAAPDPHREAAPIARHEAARDGRERGARRRSDPEAR